MKCWRCGSVDLRPYSACGYPGFDEDDEDELLYCANCHLVMSEAEDE